MLHLWARTVLIWHMGIMVVDRLRNICLRAKVRWYRWDLCQCRCSMLLHVALSLASGFVPCIWLCP